VYADDGDSPERQKRAIDVILEHRAAGTGVHSLQVLQEYFAITTRKLGTDSAVVRRIGRPTGRGNGSSIGTLTRSSDTLTMRASSTSPCAAT